MPNGFEILVNGVPRSFRDRKDVAYEGAMYLKERNKGDIVQIRDETTGVVSAILPEGRMG